MPTDLDQLEALARAATQKEPMVDVAKVWVGDRCFVAAIADVKCGRGDDFYGCHNASATPRLRMMPAYREFIAAAHPAAILALIEETRRQQQEIASLRLTLGGRTFSPTVPEPVGCPMPGACAQVAEIARLRDENAALIERVRVAEAQSTGTRHLFDAEAEGRIAGAAGRPVFDCPYDEGSQRSRSWLLGWAKS